MVWKNNVIFSILLCENTLTNRGKMAIKEVASSTSVSFSTGVVQEQFVCPAEWEKQARVWIAWNDQAYLSGESTGKVVIELIEALQPFVRVRIVVAGDGEKEQVSYKLTKSDNIEYMVIQPNDRWFRDMGPTFLKGDQGNFKIADFGYSFYGEKPPEPGFCEMVNDIHKEIARRLGLSLLETNLVSEGGNREINGKGVMICCEAVERHRNPSLDKEELEKELLRVTGQKKLIWVKQGPREDDKCTMGPIGKDLYTPTITGGHVDEFCRFVNESTILLAEVSVEERDRDPISRISYERLEETFEQLKKETDLDGNPFQIVRIPTPDHLIHDYTLPPEENSFDLTYFQGTVPGQKIQYILASSYLNFVISNGVVVMPSYWKEGRSLSIKAKDEIAKATISALFPTRQIIQLNPEAINHGGGGMHCITQHQSE